MDPKERKPNLMCWRNEMNIKVCFPIRLRASCGTLQSFCGS